jgi:hypothetical protein
MLPIFIALGLVAGIVGLAENQVEDPSIKRFLRKRRMLTIARKLDSAITLPEAEDALYLSRYFNEKKLHARFVKVVASKKQPLRRHHP